MSEPVLSPVPAKKGMPRALLILMGGLIGALIYVAIYGTKILDPTYDDWILLRCSDLTQHYLGWKFFRSEAWRFPFGLFTGLSWPIDCSIIFVDSIPLFAVFFKLLSPLLPETFQYFGLYGLLCYVLQGGIGAAILHRYTKRSIPTLIGTFFLTCSCLVLMRMYMHTALASHWLILLGILFIADYDAVYRDHPGRSIAAWGILGFLCSSIHLYFLPMCGILLLGFVLKDHLAKRKLLPVLPPLFSFLLFAALNVWLLGGFSCGGSAGGTGLGSYSFNLNGFFNARGYSIYLPTLESTGSGQLEGFAYLGIGCLLLLPFAVLAFFLAHRKQLKEKAWWGKTIFRALPWLWIIAASIIAALSPTITYGNRVLGVLPLPGILIRVWSVFRGCGRLVWPACYCIQLFALCALWENVQKPSAAVLLTGLMIVPTFLQITEQKDQLATRYEEFNWDVTHYLPINDEVWQAVAAEGKAKHIVMPTMYLSSDKTLYRIAEYADAYGMDVNYFHYAHSLGEGPTIACVEQMQNLSDDCMYVFEGSTPMYCTYDLHYYHTLGYKNETTGYYIGLTYTIPGLEEVDQESLLSMDITYNENKWLSNGEDIDGVRHLYAEGLSYGPYATVPSGTYTVTITGSHLTGASFSVTYMNGQQKGILTADSMTDEEAVFTMVLEGDGRSLEFLIRNASEEEVCIENIHLRRNGN